MTYPPFPSNHVWSIFCCFSEKIAFFVQNFGLEYEHSLDCIIDYSNALIIVDNSYFINKTYLCLAGNAWNIENCENF